VSDARRPLWIGTYPEAGADSPAGRGEGIWRVTLDVAAGTLGDARLVATTPAPSFVAVRRAAPGGAGDVLYAVGETAPGTVSAFAIEPGSDGAADDVTLRHLATVASGGDDPCHLLLAPDGRTLYVAKYSSGTLGVLPLDADGGFASAVLVVGGPVQVHGHQGSGPDAERQDAPHAHFAMFAPGGGHVLVSDLGTDELRRYRVRADGLLEADGIAATLPPGTGPRHAAVLPDGDHLVVVGELDVSVHVLAWDAATASGTVVQSLPATRAAIRTDERRSSGTNVLPAHVVVDGDLVHVSVRGADVLTTFAVTHDDGATRLEPVREVRVPGEWPRHFAVLGGPAADAWIVVADQVSGDLGVLPAAGDGTPTAVLPLPSPACVIEA
jgi:6-phosphogluconolactonase